MIFNLFKKMGEIKMETVEVCAYHSRKKQMDESIKTGIERINASTSIDEKIKIAKDILLNTRVVVDEDTLCQFEDTNWYTEDNLLKKYLEYKKTKSTIYRGIDCDVSLLSIVMYVLLSDEIELSDIINQYNSKQKYEIKRNGTSFKGDTLTSALHILKLYLGCLWKYIDNDDKLKSEKKYNEFYKLFPYVARTGVPVAPTGVWNEYCFDNSDIIWNVMDESAKQFFRCYNMFGNYMRIPGRSYQIGSKIWTSFNMARSNKGKWDTIDTLLGKIYAYYKNDDFRYLSMIFTDKKEELTQETLQWLQEFQNWSDFIEKNALSAFVDKDTLIPISLKTGYPINIETINNYDARPKNYQEFIIFFGQFSNRIILRNENIYVKLSEINTK